MSARLIRILTIVGSAALIALLHWGNVAVSPDARLGLFYLVPVLLATWFAGVWWGVVMLVASMTLRLLADIELSDASVVALLVSQASFAVVAGIMMVMFWYLQQTQRELEDLAIHDPLTRVLNARAFSERLTQELHRNRRYRRPVSLLYLDLDNFKILNDSRGHQTGDTVLRLVADAMRLAVRETDIVGRMGGDEFAVLMPETDGTLADAAAQRLAEGIKGAFPTTPAVTASIGVVSFDDTAATADEILRRADQAMYEAKRTGKDRVIHVGL
jgi:diguanylate cyclase (GGDEF)-like protein